MKLNILINTKPFSNGGITYCGSEYKDCRVDQIKAMKSGKQLIYYARLTHPEEDASYNSFHSEPWISFRKSHQNIRIPALKPGQVLCFEGENHA